MKFSRNNNLAILCGVLLGYLSGCQTPSETRIVDITAPPAPVPGTASKVPTEPVRAATLDVHGALFEYFFPSLWTDKLPSRELIPKVRDALGARLAGLTESQGMVRVLGDFSLYAGDDAISRFLQKSGKRHFVELTEGERDRLFGLWLASPDDSMRRQAAALRMFYMTGIYGSKLGWEVSGVRPPLAEDASESATPIFPPTFLRVDRESREIKAATGNIDYLVVSAGGLAGPVLAHELRRNGKRVVLVDRVPFRADSVSVGESPLAEMFSVEGTLLTEGLTTRAEGNVAPSSLSHLPQAQLARAREKGIIGQDDLSRAELVRAEAWLRRKFEIRGVQEKELTGSQKLLWESARRQGMSARLIELRGQKAAAGSTRPQRALLMAAMRDKANPVSLLSSVSTERLLVEGEGDSRRVTGIEVSVGGDPAGGDPHRLGLTPGDTFTIRAENVILAAGGAGTARLLADGISSPLVGVGPMLNPSLFVVGVFDQGIGTPEPMLPVVSIDHFALTHGVVMESLNISPLDIAASIPGNGKQTFTLISSFYQLAGLLVTVVDTPTPENRILFGEAGRMKISYSLSPEDRDRLKFAVREAARILFRAGAKRVFLPSSEGEAEGMAVPVVLYEAAQVDAGTEGLHFLSARASLFASRPQGTARMGRDPSASVASPQGKVHGVSNLWICDESLFAAPWGRRVSHSVAVLAKVLADRWNPERTSVPRAIAPKKKKGLKK